MYTVYMITYNIPEFRKNIRKALNAVDDGEIVAVHRHDTAYLIVPKDKMKMAMDHFPESAPQKIRSVSQAREGQMKVVNAAIDLGQAIAKHKSVDTCPHGSAKGFCKKADCNKKYR